MTMVFIMKGRIPSKKNELVAVVDRNDAFQYLKTLPDKVDKKDCITMLFKTFARIKNSLAYEKWEANAVEILKEQQKSFIPAAQRNGIIFPVSKATVVTKFYWKGKYRRDNSNKSEGLHDALVKAHILLDDSDRVMPDTSQGARDYSEEVTESMAVIYITVPIDAKKPTD
jgi:Holliday junction resolvase RusA-like endonuclease